MNKEIPVFFSVDNAYAPFLSVALRSAISNCSPDRQYRAIILHQDLTEKNIARLSALATDNFAVEFTAMSSGLECITDRMSNRLRCDYFTLTIYYRLFIPAMFPQYSKGIYIDSDVVVTGDLSELFDIELGDNYIGACADKSVVDVPVLANYMENAVGVDRHSYINSGVLLMDLDRLRQLDLQGHFLRLLDTYHFDCIAPDQDYINAICSGRILLLPEAWDTMPTPGKPELEELRLIHYNLFSKPWCYDGIQYADYFWHYAKDSGYYDDIVAFKQAYSEEKKQADSDCLELLMRRGAEIAGSPVTFKKIHESGVRVRL